MTSIQWKAPALAFLLLLCGCQGTGDRLIVPTPDSAAYAEMNLTCLHATSNEFVVVAGYLTQVDGIPEALMLKSEDGGQVWRRVGSETSNLDHLVLQCLHFNDARRGWAGGIRIIDGQTIPVVLRTDDGGGHWKEAALPQDRTSIVTSVAELRFTTDATGTMDIHFTDPVSSGELVNVFETTDGGRNWIIKDFKAADAVDLTDPSEIFVSADQAFKLTPDLENGTQLLLYSGSKGTNWVPRCQFHISQLPSYY